MKLFKGKILILDCPTHKKNNIKFRKNFGWTFVPPSSIRPVLPEANDSYDKSSMIVAVYIAC